MSLSVVCVVWKWLLVGGLAAAVEDVDDDRGAHQCRHAVDRHCALKARCAGNQIADQGQGRATQCSRWQQAAVVARAEDAAGQVRNGHADEHDGAAIGGDDGHQCARTDDDPCAGPFDVDAQIGGIAVAQ